MANPKFNALTRYGMVLHIPGADWVTKRMALCNIRAGYMATEYEQIDMPHCKRCERLNQEATT